MARAQTPVSAAPRSAQTPAPAPPHITLASPHLKLLIFTPDPAQGYYRGPRFDWSGIVARVECSGHTLFGPTKATHDPLNHDDLDGTAEEFGMYSPLGYDAAQPGQTFIKIGIGELEKPSAEPYGFWKVYKVVKPAPWKVTSTPTSITFAQELATPRGWAYRYTKTITVAADAPSFRIARTLTNTGTQPIDTDHYCHHFTIFDGQPAVGPQYALEFPFTLRPADAPDPADPAIKDPAGIVKLDGKTFRLTAAQGQGKSFHVTLAGYQTAADHQVRVVNTQAGVALRIVGDRPMTKLCVWSMNPMLCPEPFVAVKLAPGETMKWETRYTVEPLK